jgi:hypothetical protein
MLGLASIEPAQRPGTYILVSAGHLAQALRIKAKICSPRRRPSNASSWLRSSCVEQLFYATELGRFVRPMLENLGIPATARGWPTRWLADVARNELAVVEEAEGGVPVKDQCRKQTTSLLTARAGEATHRKECHSE